MLLCFRNLVLCGLLLGSIASDLLKTTHRWALDKKAKNFKWKTLGDEGSSLIQVLNSPKRWKTKLTPLEKKSIENLYWIKTTRRSSHPFTLTIWSLCFNVHSLLLSHQNFALCPTYGYISSSWDSLLLPPTWCLLSIKTIGWFRTTVFTFRKEPSTLKETWPVRLGVH